MASDIVSHILLTRFDGRRKLSREVRERIRSYFPTNVVPMLIRECVAIAEAPSFGVSAVDYKPNSNGAKDYLELANYLETRRQV